tara:strand:+ start:3061 stop:3438 length:378 start_codon:yes stop_codon:yes gene_type:complete
MVFWLIKTSILSLIIIAIIHYLFLFFKTNLTQPKIKDLLHHPKQEYEEILNIINNNKEHMTSHEPVLGKPDTTSIDNLPNDNIKSQSINNSMKDELSQFLLNDVNNLITPQNEGEYNNFSFNISN